MENESHAKAKWAEKIRRINVRLLYVVERNRRQEADELLRKKVITVFNESKGTYVVDRICGILRREGQTASHPVVKHIMDEEGLKSCLCVRPSQTAENFSHAR